MDAGGIAFSLSGIFGLDTVLYTKGIYQEQIVGLSGVTTNNLQNFSISPVPVSRVPEPSTLLLLLTMGLGVWVLAQKLPFKKTP